MTSQRKKLTAIIGAMEKEIQFLRAQLQNREEIRVNGLNFYQGQLNHQDVILVKSGIGKVNASLTTTLLLSKFHPDYVINTGSAGSLSKKLNIGDLVISTEVKYHDVDVTTFGYKPGQIPGMPASFFPDENLLQIVTQQVKIQPLNTVYGLIVTGSSFLNTLEKVNAVKNTFKDAIALEMEATAIAQTCYQFKVPFIVVRAISDFPEDETPSDFNLFLEKASVNSSEMVQQIIEHI